MRFFGRSLVGLFLAALTVGLLALAGQMIAGAIATRMAGDGPAQPARERVFSANVAVVTPGRVVPEMIAFGEVRSRRTLELRAPRGGTVIEVAEGFEDGAAVSEGQLLLRLDPTEAKSARDLALAAIEEAEAEGREADSALILARDDLAAAAVQTGLRAQAVARQRDLLGRGVGSEAAVETAALSASAADQAVLSRRSALAQAEARVAQAATALTRQRINLAEAERAVADTEMYASFTGRLNGVGVVVGGLVNANERLGEIIDPDALEVAFRLSTQQFARLLDAGGDLIMAPVTIGLDVMGAEVPAVGRLARVGAAVGAGASGRLVYAALDASRGFRPGDFVTVRIDEPALDGVALLPGSAVSAAGGVLVLGAENRLEEVTVEVLRRQGDDVIVTAEGLAGREVVTERSPLLGAGIRINPVRPGAAAEVAAPPATVTLSEERRAELIAQVEANLRMPAEAKARVLEQLARDEVPVQVVERLEQRQGG